MGHSGYTDCACRDCFEIAVANDTTIPELCSQCEEAGCSVDGDEECNVPPMHVGCDGCFPRHDAREDLNP